MVSKVTQSSISLNDYTQIKSEGKTDPQEDVSIKLSPEKIKNFLQKTFFVQATCIIVFFTLKAIALKGSPIQPERIDILTGLVALGSILYIAWLIFSNIVNNIAKQHFLYQLTTATDLTMKEKKFQTIDAQS